MEFLDAMPPNRSLSSCVLYQLSLTTIIETPQNNVVSGTCGKDTAPTKVSIQIQNEVFSESAIQNEVFSESAHCLLTDSLRGSAVQSLVLLMYSWRDKNIRWLIAHCVEKAYFSIETVCYLLDSTAEDSKRA